ncbi:MAG: hypothetical protein ACRCZ9_12140 [Fusobacteriaceae bacterium]
MDNVKRVNKRKLLVKTEKTKKRKSEHLLGDNELDDVIGKVEGAIIENPSSDIREVIHGVLDKELKNRKDETSQDITTSMVYMNRVSDNFNDIVFCVAWDEVVDL